MSVLDSIRRNRLERAIEDTLFAYPYLISPELKQPRRQEVLSSKSRSDLAFYFEKQVVVVEIKRGTAGPPALKQLERYLKEQKARGYAATGILVAHNFTSACLAACNKRPALACRYLDREIPTQIVICQTCRRARDRRIEFCPDDRSAAVLKALS